MRATVLSVAVVLVTVGCGSGSSRSLLEQAAAEDYPTRFVFVERPGVSFGCFSADETLVVTVDADQNVMAVRIDGDSEPVVIWTGGASFVSAALLSSGSGWIRLERDLAEPTRSEVKAAVGPSLSGYVFAEQITHDPVAVARSVLAVAGEISESESSPGDATVSVEVDPSVGAVQGWEAESIPHLRFRIVDGRIVAIAAHLPSGDEESFGLVWEYDQSADVPTIEIPQTATELADVAEINGTRDRSRAECSLEM